MNYFLCVCLLQQLASWAGNLMLKYKHNDFPSDVFTLLECVSASLTLCKFFFSLTIYMYTPGSFCELLVDGHNNQQSKQMMLVVHVHLKQFSIGTA